MIRRWKWLSVYLWVGALGLAGCAPQPPVEVIDTPTLAAPEPISTAALEDGSAITQTTAPDTVLLETRAGLVERLPNTCKLENYTQYRGQNADVLSTAFLDREWRVVTPTTIVSQEYNPARLNFYTDGSGVIERVSCG